MPEIIPGDDDLDAGLVSAPPVRTRDPATKVRTIASQAGISPDVADDYLKLTHIESGQNVNVRPSSKGALGFGQVMPDVKGGSVRTVGGRQFNLKNPDENMEAGLRYFNEGGSDPVARRLHYFGGPGAARHYQQTGQIPNISDGNMTAAQYVQATGRPQRPKPTPDPDLEAGLVTQPADSDLQAGAFGPVATPQQPANTPSTSLTTNDIAWHFGMTPDEWNGLTRAQKRKATPVLNEAVAEDQRKKATGEPIAPPPLSYQNQMRAKAGLKPLISSGMEGSGQADLMGQGAAQGAISDTDRVRNAVRASAPPGFGLLPDAAQEAIGEQVAKGASGISRLASGVVKVAPRAGTLGISNPLAESITNPITQPVRQALNQASTAAASGASQMEQQANRPTVNVPILGKVGMQDVYNIGGGAVSSAPAMVLTSLGVPAPVAFGVQSYLEAEGRDADWKDVLKETGVGTSTGALFEIPLPARMALLAKIGAKLGIVGGGTYGIEKLAGMPEAEARKNAAVNALFAASGAGKESPEEIKAPTQTVPDELQGKLRGGEIDSALAQREAVVKPVTDAQGNVLLNPDEVAQGGKPKIKLANQPTTEPAHLANFRERAPDGTFVEGAAKIPDEFKPENIAATEAPATPQPAQTDVIQPSEPVTTPQVAPPTTEAASEATTSTPPVEGAVPKSASEDLVRSAQSPNGPETHPTVRRFLSSDYKDQILKAIGSDAEPLNPTELGGIKASSVSFRKPDGSIVTVADSMFAEPKIGDASYGNKRDGFVVSKSPASPSLEPTEAPKQQPVTKTEGEQREPQTKDAESVQTAVNQSDDRGVATQGEPTNVEPSPRLTKAQQRKENERAHAAKLEAAGVEVPKEAKTYTPTTNTGDVEHANAIIDKEGLDSVVERIKKGDVEEGAIRSTLTDVTQKRLIDEANKATDPAEKLRRFGQSIDLAAADLPRTTKVAQELQAMGTIDKLSPDGSIKEAQRIVSSFDPNAKLDPARAKVFVDHANELADARKQVDDLQAKLKGNQITGETPRPRKAQARVQKTVDYLTSKENEALMRIAATKAKMASGELEFRNTGPIPGHIAAHYADYVTVGAAKLARGTIEKAAWVADMVKQFGEEIRPHLEGIRADAVKAFQQAKEQVKSDQEVRRTENVIRATPKTGEAGPYASPEQIAATRQQLRDARTRQRMAQRNLEREYRDLQDEQRSKAGLIATALNRNGLLSIKGFVNIAQALTGKHLMDAASSVLASPRDVTVKGTARTISKLPEAASNFGKAFLGKDSPVMEYWGSKTSKNPAIDLGINVMSRAFGAKEAFFRTFNEEFEHQRMASTLARLDVQSGAIKRGEKSAQTERYLNEGATPGPKAQEWLDSKALKAARYEAAEGRITESMIDIRKEDLSKDVPKLLGVLKEQYADRQVSADPSITAKTVRRGVSASKQVHPVAGAIAKGAEEGFAPFLTRPVRSIADWLGSYTGAKLLVGSKAGMTAESFKQAGAIKGTAQAFFQGDIYKAIESKFAPHEVEELKRTLSRTTTNAGLIVLGAVLAKKNLLDEDGKIHANGRAWSIGDVPFVGWSLAFGAGMQKNGPTGGLKSLAKVISHHPLIRGVTDLSDNVGSILKGDAKVLPAAEREAGSIAGRFIPHPLPDIAEAMSTKERTSPGFTGPMLYRVPYMRDKLDPRLTPMGEEIPKSRLSVIDPYRSQPDLRSQWPLAKDLEPNELQRAPQRMTKVNETDAEYLQRQKTEGPVVKQALQELANDPEYPKLTKAQQRKARVRVELEARKAAREYLPAPQRRIAQREAQQ